MPTFQQMMEFSKKLKLSKLNEVKGDSVENLHNPEDEVYISATTSAKALSPVIVCQSNKNEDSSGGKLKEVSSVLSGNKLIVSRVKATNRQKSKPTFITPTRNNNQRELSRDEMLEALRASRPSVSKTCVDETSEKGAPAADDVEHLNLPNSELVTETGINDTSEKDIPVADDVDNLNLPNSQPSAGESMNTNKEVFKCDECKFTFQSFNRLQVHINKGCGNIPIKCDKCEMSLKNRKLLSRHMKKVHERGLCVCAECENGFKTPKLLEKHYFSEHVKQVCPYCKNLFKNRNTLRSHKNRCVKHSDIGVIAEKDIRKKETMLRELVSPVIVVEEN